MWRSEVPRQSNDSMFRRELEDAKDVAPVMIKSITNTLDRFYPSAKVKTENPKEVPK